MLQGLFSFLVYTSSLVLIILVALQTTKSEGFTGAIGGGVQSSSRYLPGSEEVLQNYTTWTAAIWMAVCLGYFIVTNHVH